MSAIENATQKIVERLGPCAYGNHAIIAEIINEFFPACLPANWLEDSSLDTWFPLTAEELKRKKAELDAAWNEISCCDDVRLDQSLNLAISDLQAARVLAEKELGLVKFCLQGLLDVLSGKNKEFAQLLVEFGQRGFVCQCLGARTATNRICDVCHRKAEWA